MQSLKTLVLLRFSAQCVLQIALHVCTMRAREDVTAEWYSISAYYRSRQSSVSICIQYTLRDDRDLKVERGLICVWQQESGDNSILGSFIHPWSLEFVFS